MNDDEAAVEFRSEIDGKTLLRLSYEREDDDFGMLVAEAALSDLTFTHAAPSLRGDGLDAFLAELADDWRGWQGVRGWQTLEDDLSIEATHEGHRVRLVFIVRGGLGSDGWQIRLPVPIAPGEGLTRVAKEVANLFAPG
jgi:hypothetical protein